MSKIIKSKIFNFCVVLLLLFSTVFCYNAKAETTVLPLTLEQVTYFMKQGASVRTVESSSGLRFTALISNDEYAGLKANTDYKSLTFGMFIVPYDYVYRYGEINYDNVFGKNAIYCFTETEDKIQIINITTDELCEFSFDNNYMALNGVIIDMYTHNFCRDFIGVGYIKAETDVSTEYKFAVGEDNVRSVTYVAGRAIEDGNYDSSSISVLQSYVDNSSTIKTAYTVETYLCGNKDTVTSETFETTVGATISVTPTTVDGYVLDNERSVLSSIALAGGKSVLKVYYQSEDFLSVNLTDESFYTFDLSKDTFTIDTSAFYGEVKTINGVSVTDIDGRIVLDKNTLLSLTGNRIDEYSGTGGEFRWTVVTPYRNYKINVTLADKVIVKADDLIVLTENPYGYYVLGDNVFVNGALQITSEFNGVLDGREYKISNVTVSTGKGIFSNVGSSGVIKNTAFTNVNSSNSCLVETLYGSLENVFVSSANAQTVVNYMYGNAENIVCSLTQGKFVFRNYAPTGSLTAENVYAVMGNASGTLTGICNKVNSYNGLTNTMCCGTVSEFLSVLNNPESLGSVWSGNGRNYLKHGDNYVLTA